MKNVQSDAANAKMEYAANAFTDISLNQDPVQRYANHHVNHAQKVNVLSAFLTSFFKEGPVSPTYHATHLVNTVLLGPMKRQVVIAQLVQLKTVRHAQPLSVFLVLEDFICRKIVLVKNTVSSVIRPVKFAVALSTVRLVHLVILEKF